MGWRGMGCEEVDASGWLYCFPGPSYQVSTGSWIKESTLQHGSSSGRFLYVCFDGGCGWWCVFSFNVFSDAALAAGCTYNERRARSAFCKRVCIRPGRKGLRSGLKAKGKEAVINGFDEQTQKHYELAGLVL